MDEFYHLVQSATREQRQNLGQLTGSTFGSSPETLCNHIRYLSAGGVGQLFWDKSWKQVVTDVADHVQIDWDSALNGRQWRELDTPEIETAVIAKLTQTILDQVSSEQRQQILRELRRETDDPKLESFIVTGSLMSAAKMSGFGVYLLASTVLGSFTNVLGITLPFAIYLGMSQTIAVVLGPVGWAALAGGILFSLNQPNWNRLILAVVCVSMIRNSPS
ncbi:MAG TPA: hypothetical protein ACFE0H_05760 [Elainellaceae cyanobacterium]